MAKWRIIRFSLQGIFMLLTGIAVFSLPDISPRPPALWSDLLLAAGFAFGVVWGVGFGHLFPGPGEEF